MNRRGFLSLFAPAAAIACVDPERLLWAPGNRKFFIPSPPAQPVIIPPLRLSTKFAIGDLITLANNPCRFVVTEVAESSVQFKPLPRAQQSAAFLRYVDTYPRIEASGYLSSRPPSSPVQDRANDRARLATYPDRLR